MGEHLDGPGFGRHHRGVEVHCAARLRRHLRLPGPVASAGHPVVHLGHRHRRRRPAVLHLPPDRAPGAADLGHPPGAPLQPVLQFRHRTAAEVEQQRRDPDVDSVAAAGHSAVDGVRQLLDQPHLPVLGAHRAHRQALAANRIHFQHAVAPPGAPRHGPDVPRQELRRHPDHLGPHVRHLPARVVPSALRADQAGQHVQHLEAADPRIRGHRPRRARGDAVAGPARLHFRPARLGASTDVQPDIPAPIIAAK